MLVIYIEVIISHVDNHSHLVILMIIVKSMVVTRFVLIGLHD